MNPIFIMSSERSGSNLVRKMLGAHSQTSAPPPLHLWGHLSNNLPHYGSLAGPQNFENLVADAILMTDVPGSHLNWDCKISAAEVLERVRVRNITGLVGALYEVYALKEGKTYWVCKENNLFDHAARIIHVFPNARFIYLCRDGRDYACSVKKVPTHDQHIYYIAKEWRDEQQKCIEVFQDLVDSGTIMLLRYEDLISNPENKLQELCKFLDLKYEKGMIQFYSDSKTKEEAEKTVFWKNLASPVMSGNMAKFRIELSQREIALFEHVASDMLEVLGYPLFGERRIQKVRRINKIYYSLKNQFERRRKLQDLVKEPGRRERAAALRTLSDRGTARKRTFAPPITYEPYK